jgi:hypothetical protein
MIVCSDYCAEKQSLLNKLNDYALEVYNLTGKGRKKSSQFYGGLFYVFMGLIFVINSYILGLSLEYGLYIYAFGAGFFIYGIFITYRGYRSKIKL